VGELMGLDLENAHWWFRDPGTGEVDHIQLEAFRHNYPSESMTDSQSAEQQK
jgi:hypothetical protein